MRNFEPASNPKVKLAAKLLAAFQPFDKLKQPPDVILVHLFHELDFAQRQVDEHETKRIPHNQTESHQVAESFEDNKADRFVIDAAAAAAAAAAVAAGGGESGGSGPIENQRRYFESDTAAEIHVIRCRGRRARAEKRQPKSSNVVLGAHLRSRLHLSKQSDGVVHAGDDDFGLGRPYEIEVADVAQASLLSGNIQQDAVDHLHDARLCPGRAMPEGGWKRGIRNVASLVEQIFVERRIFDIFRHLSL